MLGRPDEVVYYLVHAPADTAVAEPVRIAGTRWAIEEALQAAENECGLDPYEVRRHPGRYGHITLALLAPTFLAAMAAVAGTARGRQKRVPMLTPRSSWRRSGASWRLAVPR